MTIPDPGAGGAPVLALPKLERTAPRRGLAGVGRLDDGPAGANGAPATGGRPLTSTRDVIEHAIRVAQEVIDQQIGSGERILRHLRKAPIPKTRTSPFEGKSAASLTERTVVLTNELGVLAIELLETLAQSPTVIEVLAKWMGAKGRLPSVADFPWPPGLGLPLETTIDVLVSSRKPAKATARVLPAVPGPLRVDGLLCAGAPPILAVAYVPEPRAFRVTIPDDQPAGVYFGVIVSADGQDALGTLCATVSDP